MDFAVLGPLRVDRARRRRSSCQRAKQRALLAMLLLSHRDGAVSSARLIDALWGEAPARRPPVKALQVYVSQLRRALGGDTIVTRAPGTRSRSTRSSWTSRASRRWSPGRAASRPSRPPPPCATRWRSSAARRWPTRRWRAPPPPRPTGSRACAWPRSSSGSTRPRARPRPPRRARHRARDADRRAPLPRALPRAADARALPRRPPGRRARRLPPRPPRAGRGPRAGAEPRAAAPGGRDPRPGPGARRRAAPRPRRRRAPGPRRRRCPSRHAAARPRRRPRDRARRCSPTPTSACSRSPARAGSARRRFALELAHRLGDRFAEGARFVALGRARRPRARRRRARAGDRRAREPRAAARGRQLRAAAGRRAASSARAVAAPRAPSSSSPAARRCASPPSTSSRSARSRRRPPSRSSSAAPAPSTRGRARRGDERSTRDLRAARRPAAGDRARRRAHEGPLPGRDPRPAAKRLDLLSSGPARRARSASRRCAPRSAGATTCSTPTPDAVQPARRLQRRLHARPPPRRSAGRRRWTASPRWPTTAC